MMSKVEQYRLLVEDKILMEETFRVMEKGMVDWKTYYRVGNDLTGLMRPVVQKADKDLEYIRSQNQRQEKPFWLSSNCNGKSLATNLWIILKIGMSLKDTRIRLKVWFRISPFLKWDMSSTLTSRERKSMAPLQSLQFKVSLNPLIQWETDLPELIDPSHLMQTPWKICMVIQLQGG